MEPNQISMPEMTRLGGGVRKLVLSCDYDTPCIIATDKMPDKYKHFS